MSSPLPALTRLITTNDDNGASFFSREFLEQVPVIGDLGGALQRLCYVSNPGPDELSGQADFQPYLDSLRERPPLIRPGGGTNVWSIDVPPESESPMHRTLSVDIVVVVTGTIELTLEKEGHVRWVRAGDVVVQRATMHKWRNPSETEWVRMIAVMTECRPVVTEGAGELGAFFPAHTA